jgi:hypothetical protein
LFLREWYMHPNGQIPAYEWAFSDVNPPVHAWSCQRVFEIDRTMTGVADVDFLARTFHKLLINFTWWVNRKDPEGEHLFSGGFLGLDNIGLFDRSKPLPIGGRLHQADGVLALSTLTHRTRCTGLVVNELTRLHGLLRRNGMDGAICGEHDEHCPGAGQG